MAEWVRFNYPATEERFITGKWDWECSECGNLQTFRTKTCKRCRADMGDGIEERGKDADSNTDNSNF